MAGHIGFGMKKILDACCGSRKMWVNKEHEEVVFCDIRSETITVKDRSHVKNGKRIIVISPDVVMNYEKMPFKNNTFDMVVFDPPHLLRAGPNGWMKAAYGKLPKNWDDSLKNGFCECFRVLKACGTLVFKWSESQIPLRMVVSLSPIPPLFGNVSGVKRTTHWIVFYKR